MTPKIIAVTQRVDVIAGRDERRDALDQRWIDFLQAINCQMLVLPNSVTMAQSLLERVQPDGIVLTGGNDLCDLGGDAPERDETERMAIDWAAERRVPLLAVCRGLQLLVHHLSGALKRIDGHVAKRHDVVMETGAQSVNSFHNWGIEHLPPTLSILGKATDGEIEAVRHVDLPIIGVMWHPERDVPFRAHDLELVGKLFKGRA
jgi:putative glutamine amidotransferase